MLDDSGKRAKVRTKVPGDNGDVAVEYSMGLRDGKWKIYDVYVEGVSLVQNYQSQFRSLFEKESATQGGHSTGSSRRSRIRAGKNQWVKAAHPLK